jgi:peptidoglycan/LPS O-acetylase OafA/YrhL
VVAGRVRDAHLDGIRGVAVLLVVLYHTRGPHGFADGALLPGGWLGVQVFFVLSGYLITRLLLAEHDETGTVDRRAFYRRRARRLLPALSLLLAAWLAVTLSGALAVQMLGNDAPRIDRSLALAPLLGLATVSYNWLLAFDLPTPSGMGHLWTLSVEEQFYLLLPTVVLLARRRLREIVVLAIGASLVATVWEQMHGHRDFVYFSTPTSGIGLLLGAAVAIKAPSVGRRGAVAALALLTVAALSVADDDARLLPWAAIAGAIGAVALIVERPEFLAHPWLGYAGRRSYAVYLWNLPLGYALEIHHLPTLPVDIVMIAGSFVLAELSWRLVERRFLVRRERPGRRRALHPVLSGEGGI